MKNTFIRRGAALAVGLSSIVGCSPEAAKESVPTSTIDVSSLNPNIQFADNVPPEIRESMSEVYDRYAAEFGCAAGRIAVQYDFIDTSPGDAPGIIVVAKTEGNSITFNIAAGIPDEHEEAHELSHGCVEQTDALDPTYSFTVAPDQSLIVDVHGFAAQSQVSQQQDAWYPGLDEAVAEIAADTLYPKIEGSSDPKYINWKDLGQQLMLGSGVTIHDMVRLQQQNRLIDAASLLLPFNPLNPREQKVACLLGGFSSVRDGMQVPILVSQAMQRDC